MLLFRGRGLVRPALVLGQLRPNVDKGVVVPLVVVQLLRQEVDNVRRHLEKHTPHTPTHRETGRHPRPALHRRKIIISQSARGTIVIGESAREASMIGQSIG